MRNESSVESQHDTGVGAGGCGCIPHAESGAEVAVISGCVCQGVERVVQQTKKRRTGDVVKVIAFAALLAALVVGLVLWL